MAEYVDYIMKKFADAQRKLSAIEEKANKETDKEADMYAAKTLTPYIEKDIIDIYRNAVDAWYRSYAPKVYKRVYSLFNVLHIDERDGIYAGWQYVDDGLYKNSIWGGISYNIYDLVFEGGFHGGNLYHYAPPRSTPIPEVFESRERDYINKNRSNIVKKFNELGDEYFNEHAAENVAKRLRAAYGSEFDWLIG